MLTSQYPGSRHCIKPVLNYLLSIFPYFLLLHILVTFTSSILPCLSFPKDCLTQDRLAHSTRFYAQTTIGILSLHQRAATKGNPPDAFPHNLTSYLHFAMSDPREVTSEVPPNRALPPLLMEDLPPSLQSLINRHPPHAIQSADNTTWTVSEVSSPAEETTSAVSVECGTESVTESVAPATSVSNDLSTAEVESLVDSYIAGRTSDFWKDLTFGNDFQTDEPELESWDKRMEQLSYDKDRLEERLKKLRETILACGGTRDQLWRQCRSLRQTIKSLCEARYGIQSMGGRSCKKLDDGLTSGMIQVNGTGHPIYLDQNHATGIKPHQVRGVSFLFRQIVQEKLPSGALLAHEMGLGKTFQV